MNTIESLLGQVSLINMTYAKLEEATQSSFNIFSILRQESEEVALHSRFLAELLDPNGSHKCGDIFQKLFMKNVFDSNWEDEESLVVQYEISMGSFGRVDILLKGTKHVYVIENKIYADDQPKQLERYFKAFQGKYSDNNIHIFYLTLDGHKASDNSRGGIHEDKVNLISYELNILSWLELCAKESFRTPHLRETIIQYITLIKKLTGQSLSMEHKMEVVKLLLTENNFEYALSIEKSLVQAKIEIQKLVWKELIDEFKSKNYHFNFVKSNFDSELYSICDGFYLSGKNRSRCYGMEIKVADVNGYTIHMVVEIYHRIYYGFAAALNGKRGEFVDDVNKVDPSLQNKISMLTDWSQTPGKDWWFAYKYPQEKINFMTFDGTTAKLANPEYRKTWVEKTSAEIIDLIQDFKM